MEIREVRPSDADKLAVLMEQVDNSGFMLYRPAERKVNPEKLKIRIQNSLDHPGSVMFVAEEGDELVGYLLGMGESAVRAAHSVYAVVGIAEGYRGTGIGQQLFASLEEWAKRNGIHRLELTVMEHNEAAKALYKKMGFIIEGIKRDSLLVDHQYVNELYMAKLI